MLPWMLILLYLLVIAPVQLGGFISLGRGPNHGMLAMNIWGIGIRKKFSLLRNEQGQLTLESNKKKKKKRKKRKFDRIRALLFSLIRYAHVRKLLRLGARLQSLEGEAWIHLENAAHTALLSALCQALSALSGKARFRIFPCFSAPSHLRLQCIVHFRLGTLLLACAAARIHDFLQRKKEENTWTIPSDT